MIDFTKEKRSFQTYGGAEGKRSIVIDGKLYMVKLPKKIHIKKNEDIGSYTNSPLSENIGCRIFDALGVPAQKTLLGTYDGKLAVACEDFLLNDPIKAKSTWQLQEFSTIEHSILDSSDIGFEPSLENINYTFENHQNLAPIKNEAIQRYWETFVIDALIGNFDRHSGNWGYLVDINTGTIELAPVYDCGSSLYSRTDEKAIPSIMNDNEKIRRNIFDVPHPTLTIDGKKTTYHECLRDSSNKPLQEALLKIAPKIDMNKIKNIIANTDGISENWTKFLQFMVTERNDKIIIPEYRRAVRTLEREKDITQRTASKGLDDRLNRADALSRSQPSALRHPNNQSR